MTSQDDASLVYVTRYKKGGDAIYHVQDSAGYDIRFPLHWGRQRDDEATDVHAPDGHVLGRVTVAEVKNMLHHLKNANSPLAALGLYAFSGQEKFEDPGHQAIPNLVHQHRQR